MLHDTKNIGLPDASQPVPIIYGQVVLVAGEVMTKPDIDHTAKNRDSTMQDVVGLINQDYDASMRLRGVWIMWLWRAYSRI